MLKNKREQLKANLISSPELNRGWDVEIGPVPLLDLFSIVFVFIFSLSFIQQKKKLLLTRSTGTIDPSLSFLYDFAFNLFLYPYQVSIDMVRTLPSVIIS